VCWVVVCVCVITYMHVCECAEERERGQVADMMVRPSNWEQQSDGA
jgi:hypothetical protein